VPLGCYVWRSRTSTQQVPLWILEDHNLEPLCHS